VGGHISTREGPAFSSSVLTGTRPRHWQPPHHCRRVVLSLQGEGKPRTNFTWFSPHGYCSPVQGLSQSCHPLSRTHGNQAAFKVSQVTASPQTEQAKDFKDT
jgi:hypothetical protein